MITFLIIWLVCGLLSSIFITMDVLETTDSDITIEGLLWLTAIGLGGIVSFVVVLGTLFMEVIEKFIKDRFKNILNYTVIRNKKNQQ